MAIVPVCCASGNVIFDDGKTEEGQGGFICGRGQSACGGGCAVLVVVNLHKLGKGRCNAAGDWCQGLAAVQRTVRLLAMAHGSRSNPPNGLPT
jgi:hypothetical protein